MGRERAFEDNTELAYDYLTLGPSDFPAVLAAKREAERKISEFTAKRLIPAIESLNSIQREIIADEELGELIFAGNPNRRKLYQRLIDGENNIKEDVMAEVSRLKALEATMLANMEETRQHHQSMLDHSDAQMGMLLINIMPAIVQYFGAQGGLHLRLPAEIQGKLLMKGDTSPFETQAQFTAYISQNYTPQDFSNRLLELMKSKDRKIAAFGMTIQNIFRMNPEIGLEKSRLRNKTVVTEKKRQEEINRQLEEAFLRHQRKFITEINSMTNQTKSVSNFEKDILAFRNILEVERKGKQLRARIQEMVQDAKQVIAPIVQQCRNSVKIYLRCQQILPSEITVNIASYMADASKIETEIKKIVDRLAKFDEDLMVKDQSLVGLVRFETMRIDPARENYDKHKEALVLKAKTIVDTAQEAIAKLDMITFGLNNIYQKFSSVLLENDKVWENLITGKSVTVDNKTFKAPHRISKMISALQNPPKNKSVDQRLQSIFDAFNSDDRKIGFFTNISRSQKTERLYNIIRFAKGKSLYDVDVLNEMNQQLDAYMRDLDRKYKTSSKFIAKGPQPKIPLVQVEDDGIELTAPGTRAQARARKRS